MTADAEDLRNEITESGRNAFRFLEEGSSRVEVDDEGTRTVLAYVMGRAAFEVELDWREQCVFVLYCRAVDGKRPPGYYVHDGVRVRVHLAQVLGLGNDADRAAARKLKESIRRSGPKAMASQLTLFADVLRNSLHMVLAAFDDIFGQSSQN